MTSTSDLSEYLRQIDLGAWRFLPVTGSTNDVALAWAQEGAPDWSLVVADAQTAGRGRRERHWMTAPGGALAISLVLRPSPDEVTCFPRFTALAALGLIRALAGLGLDAALKWPNDVLLEGKKVAGVLVEADWQGDQVKATVVGMGVNVAPSSVPAQSILRYPATAVETALGRGVDRWALMAETLRSIRDYRAILVEDAFVDAWNAHLALRGERVPFKMPDKDLLWVKVSGVRADGQLALELETGEQFDTHTGEILMVDKYQ